MIDAYINPGSKSITVSVENQEENGLHIQEKEFNLSVMIREMCGCYEETVESDLESKNEMIQLIDDDIKMFEQFIEDLKECRKKCDNISEGEK